MGISILTLRFNSIVRLMNFRLSEGVPADPNNLPEEPEGCVAIYNGVLSVINPILNDLNQALADYRENEMAWLRLALDCNGQERLDVENALAGLVGNADSTVLVPAVRERASLLTRIQTDVTVKLRAAELMLMAHRASIAPTPPFVTPPTGTTPVGAATPAAIAMQYPPLPKGNVPSFDGRKPSEWLNFWDLFTSLVDKNPMAPKVQKLAFLKSKLQGKASNLLAHLTITEANYQVAKDLLMKKYADGERAVRELRADLFALPYCRTSLDVRDFQERSEMILKQLEAHGKPVAGEEVMQFLWERLPRYYVEKLLEAKKARLAFDLDDFREKLEELINDEEKITQICGLGNKRIGTFDWHTPGKGFHQVRGTTAPPKITSSVPSRGATPTLTFAAPTNISNQSTENIAGQMGSSNPSFTFAAPAKTNNLPPIVVIEAINAQHELGRLSLILGEGMRMDPMFPMSLDFRLALMAGQPIPGAVS